MAEKKTTKKEKVVDNKKNVDIEIKGKEWNEALDKAFENKVKTVEVPGFRKGKVPRNIYEQKFGKESLYFDAADLVLQDAYMKSVSEIDFDIACQPSVDLKAIDDEHVVFTFIFTKKPEAKVKKYTKLGVKKPTVKVTKEEIDNAVKGTLDRYAELVVKKGKVAEGDVAIIDFEGFKDGVPFEGGKGENYSLEIGSHTFIPGFEEQVVGMKAEEEKDINVTFPKEYPAKDLAGKEVVFKVKVHEVKTKEQRKLDKDFFEDLALPGVDSKETLEEELKKNIEAQKMEEENSKYLDELLAEIAKNTEVEIPEEMVHEEVHNMMHRFEDQLRMQGLDLNTYYKYTNSDETALHDQMHDEAYNHVLYSLMLEAITKKEKIEVKDKEVSEEAEKEAKKYGMEKDAFLNAFGGESAFKYDLEIRKVIEFLKENN